MSEKTEQAQWDVDPDEWPHTPPLHVWRRLYEDDDNLVWRAGIGHVVNALDAALERIEAVESLLTGWENAHTHLGIERGNWGPPSSALRRALAGSPTPPGTQADA